MAEIRVNATGGLKLYDADDSHYAQIVAGTITSNVDAITLGHDTVTIADNLSLGSDSAILKLGADGDATLTHDGTTGLTIAATPISIDATGELHLNSTTGDIKLQDGGTDQIAFDLDGTAGEVIMKPAVDSDDLVISQYDGTEVIRIEDNASLGLVGNKLSIANSSSDVVIKPLTDAKDIIFQQYDGTEVARIEDNATFNVSSAGKFAYAGTAVTATAAELNLLDGGTSVGSSITLADADGVVVNDGGTMKTIPASDVKTYAGGGRATLLSTTTLDGDSNVVFTSSLITSTYDNYLITFENILTGSGNVYIEMFASVDNGSNYHTASGDYRKISFNGIENESNNSFTSRYGTNENDIRITGNYANNGNDAALKIDATCLCFTLNSSSYKKFLVHSAFGDASDPPKLVYENALHLFDDSQSAVNNLKIQASSGTLTSGKIKLFGLK